MTAHTCSLCETVFDDEQELGVVGEIGMLPVVFCTTCRAGVTDMVQQSCLQCGDAGEL